MQHLILLLSLFFSFTTAFAPVSSALDELQIRNKLSLYSLALDNKNFDLLDQIFTPDVVVDYRVPNTSVLNGLPAVKSYLVKALTGFLTQHTMSSTVVEVLDGSSFQNGTHAVQGFTSSQINSTIYLVANYLGQGNLTGQAGFIYGVYRDTWAQQKNGLWLSKARTLDLIGNSGSLAVITTPYEK